MKNIFRCIDKDNNGFIVLNNRQNIIKIFNRDNSGINREILKILEKMIKILYEINKKNNNIDFDDDKIIINENIFVKYMIYIYNNKLNINEKKIFFSSKNDFDKIIKKDLLFYNFKPKSSFSKYKDNKKILQVFNSSGRLNKKKEKMSITNDEINKYFFYKLKRNSSNYL